MIVLPVSLVAVADLPPAGAPDWERWLHPAELSYCRAHRSAGEHLAGRIAAKRAVASALSQAVGGTAGIDPPWGDIEIGRALGSSPMVTLHGTTESHHRDLGLPRPGVSISHGGGFAAAVAWLPDDPGPARTLVEQAVLADGVAR